MKKYIIIGGGIAAAACINGIRSIDSDSEITVVAEEKNAIYFRPLISYYLEGKTDPVKMLFRSSDYYERMNCKMIYGHKAISICEKDKSVRIDDDTTLAYDSLCIATGSSPFVPPFDGLECVQYKTSFMTLDDAFTLEQMINESSRVLIVGAGLIGLKCAEGICKRVKSVAVCDLADRVLSSILDSECAGMMQRRLEENGVKFYLSDSAVKFEKNTAFMKSGAEVDFDVLVLAVGVRPNISLLKAIGGDVNRGILVNHFMETSIAGIFAAGDCTESFDASSGQNKIMAILPNAVMQGFAAGVNMAGGSESFDKGIPMNSIGFFGLHAMTAGTYEGEMLEEKSASSIKRLFIKDDRLIGFILVGCDERAGIYTSLIREKTPLSSINFELMKKGATTAAFPPDIRGKKFGGVI